MPSPLTPHYAKGPQAWPRWAQVHLVLSKQGPWSPDHRTVVLGAQLFHLLQQPIWRALGAQGRRAPGRDTESTAEAQPLVLAQPSGKSWKDQALEGPYQ